MTAKTHCENGKCSRCDWKRVFCWLPTPVYSSPYWRDGFRWLRFVWRGDDGKHYTTR